MRKYALRIIFLILLIASYSLSYFLYNNPSYLLFFNQAKTTSEFNQLLSEKLQFTEEKLNCKLVTDSEITQTENLTFKTSNNEFIRIQMDEALSIYIPLSLNLNEDTLIENYKLSKNFNKANTDSGYQELNKSLKSLNLKNLNLKTIYVLGLILDSINPDNTPLSKQTSYNAKFLHICNTWLEQKFNKLLILNLAILALLTFLFSYLVSRRSISATLRKSLKEYNLEESDAKIIILKILPHLIFPIQSSEDVIKSSCERYRLRLDKISYLNEKAYFENHAMVTFLEIKEKTFDSSFYNSIKNLTVANPKEDSASLINKLNRLQKISNLADWILLEISSSEQKYLSNKIWAFLSENIHNKSVSNLKEDIKQILKSNILNNQKDFSLYIKTKQIKFVENSPLSNTESKESIIDPNKEFVDLNLNHISQPILRRLKIIKDKFGAEKVKYLAGLLSMEQLTEKNIYILSQSNNEYEYLKQLDIISKTENKTNDTDLFIKPFLGKHVLLAGGDLDQSDFYKNILTELGATKVTIIFQNNQEAQSKLRSDFDIAMYIATKISHSLRFALTNQINKGNTQLYILNHSRTGFQTELLNKFS